MQKKHCEMRQIYMQKTLRNALLFCKFSIYFLHMNFAHFSVSFAGKFAENCVAIFYIFQAFSWWFLWNCVQGWERRDPGQIPVWRNGIDGAGCHLDLRTLRVHQRQRWFSCEIIYGKNPMGFLQKVKYKNRKKIP